tara:strand:- start:185 stop:778 length:594 start_codon:yes stop_codon:yes gene_type:complete
MIDPRVESNRLGFPVFTGPGNLNLYAVRSRSSHAGRFDDVLGLFGQTSLGGFFHKIWPVTLDPGLHYLKHFYPGQSACAVYAPGFYRAAYAIGTHIDHQALVQIGPISIFRDGNMNDVIDPDPDNIDSGLFGMNVHSPFVYDLDFAKKDVVGQKSAGCIVHEVPANHEEMMGIIKRNISLNGRTLSIKVFSERGDGI